MMPTLLFSGVGGPPSFLKILAERGVARKANLFLEMQIKVTAVAGAGRDETCCFGVTLFRFGQASSFSSAAAFQAPCRPLGSNLSPFCTLQTMAAKLCRGVLVSLRLVSLQPGCWRPHSAPPRPGCSARSHVLQQGWTSCALWRAMGWWRCFEPRAINDGLKVTDVTLCKDLAKDAGLWQSLNMSLKLGNLHFRIEDWIFSRTLVGKSSTQDWRLKIPQDSSWRIFNPGENL